MERIGFQQVPKDYYAGMFAMGDFLKKNDFDKGILELVKYRASQINGCAYCLDMHYKEALHHGETQLRLSSLSAWEETPYFTEREQAALQYTEALTQVSANAIGEDIYAPLKKHFSKEEIAQLTMAIVLINGWNRFMKAFKITPGNYKVGMYD